MKEAERHGLYRARLVDRVEPNGSKRSKSCAAACNDHELGWFIVAPTIRHISVRLLLSVTVLQRFRIIVRNISKAHVMSRTPLRRLVFMQPPRKTGVVKGKLVKVVRPVYGLPESPMHWFKSYSNYHKRTLSITKTTLDTCLLFRKVQSN